MIEQSWAWLDPAIAFLTRFGGGFAILLVGWLLARVLSWAAFRALQRTTLDDRIAETLGLRAILDSSEDKDRLERILARALFWTTMLFVSIAALKQAGLAEAAIPIERFLSTVAGALPNIAKAVLILAVAWVAALGVRRLVGTALAQSGLDVRFAELSRGEPPAVAQNTAQAAYWLVLVFGLAGAFDALQISPLAVPLRNVIDQVVTRLPSIGVAALFLAAGWLVGRLGRTVVQNLLTSFGVDALAERAGLTVLFAGRAPGEVVGLAVHGFVLLQATIAALNQLGIRTLSEPLTRMMERFWLLLPDLAVGVLLLAVGFVVGRLARGVVSSALKGFGFDGLLSRLGFGKLDRWHPSLDEPSEIVGLCVQVGISLAAVAQVLENLGLTTWASYVNGVLAYAVQNVGVALVIVGIGFAVAGVVRDLVVARSDADAEGQRWMGELGRYAVLVFTFTMALRHLEVAEDFVLLSFGLLFGALCLAGALAFGLGGREVAADIVKRRYQGVQQRLVVVENERPDQAEARSA